MTMPGFIGAGYAPVLGQLYTCTQCGCLVNTQGRAVHEPPHQLAYQLAPRDDADDSGT